jgi:hypothetical protein
LELGRVAEQVVHQRPEPLLLREARRLVVGVHAAGLLSARPGILAGVTRALADRNANITDLETRVLGTEDEPVYAMVVELVDGGVTNPDLATAIAEACAGADAVPVRAAASRLTMASSHRNPAATRTVPSVSTATGSTRCEGRDSRPCSFTWSRLCRPRAWIY